MDTMYEIKQTLEMALELARIASDWNLDEVEIGCTMVSMYALAEMFEQTIDNLPTMPQPEMGQMPDEVREGFREIFDFIKGYFPNDPDMSICENWLNSLPNVPEPDWDANEDAKWRTIDARGEVCYWMGSEPYIEKRQHFWTCKEGLGFARWDDHIDLPLGIDWRTTLFKRREE